MNDFLNRVYGDETSPFIEHPWWENAAMGSAKTARRVRVLHHRKRCARFWEGGIHTFASSAFRNVAFTLKVLQALFLEN